MKGSIALFSISTLVTYCAAAVVKVDLVPCILAPAAIERDSTDAPESYLISEFYKGFWGGSQLTPPPTTGSLDIRHSDTHGKCNVIYVGDEVTDDQKADLQEYSRTFKVRIVYFNSAETSNDVEVTTRLGISQDWDSEELVSAPFISLSEGGAQSARIVPPSLKTDPRQFSFFTRPVIQINPAVGGEMTVIAEYVDENGANVPSVQEETYPSVAAVAYASDDGYEELHVFFAMAWFDIGSWAWGHFVVEWGTKGVFQGERRFFLAGVVDDLFLGTGEFSYGEGDYNMGEPQRLTASDMQAYADFENGLNAKYGSSIITEWAFNANGVLIKTDSAHVIYASDSEVALLDKGDKVVGEGVPSEWPEDWLAVAVPGMKAEFEGGKWDSDDLFTWVMANKEQFWWQSHTFTHLSRDNLGEHDCSVEDGGSAQFAVLTGLFQSNNYNWRSMTTPRITGLYNKYCLESGRKNLMTCMPGDNTWNFENGTPVSLVNEEQQFHSIYTTEETNGLAGMQIVPRYATNVYFNCISGECLVEENEYVRRIVCECENLDPSKDRGKCSDECGDDIQSFGSIEELFENEAMIVSRQILMGRRDKYMFHQANAIPTSLSGGSLLAHWYESVMEKMTSFISFPVTSSKFDDLCTDFQLHEALDESDVVLTATLDNASGDVSDVSLSSSGTVGYVPFTVPSGSAIPTSGLIVGDTKVYGSDTTYYVTTSAKAVPTVASAPSEDELATVPTITVDMCGAYGGIYNTSSKGDICCAATCGTCSADNGDCKNRPGGRKHCCPYNIRTTSGAPCSATNPAPCILSDEPEPVAPTPVDMCGAYGGIYNTSNEGDICCAATCGTCSADNGDCKNRPGGRKHCCPYNIRTTSGTPCSATNPAPCILSDE